MQMSATPSKSQSSNVAADDDTLILSSMGYKQDLVSLRVREECVVPLLS